MLNNNEDALTHGLTVMECENKYRLKYYRYLLKQRSTGMLSEEYFKDLADDYETYRQEKQLKKITLEET